MKKTKILIMLIASFAILLGLLMFTGALMANGWDFSKISTSEAVVNTYEISESVSDISIDVDTDDISFLPSEDGKAKLVFYESETLKHSVKIEDGKLKIEVVDTRKWYNYIFNFIDEKIVFYLPSGNYSSLNVKCSTGNVEINSALTFKTIDVALSTGRVTCEASSTVSTKITASTGDIKVSGVTSGELKITTSTGDIHVLNSSVGDAKIEVSTGDVKLTDVNCKSLTTNGDTGKVKMQRLVAKEKIIIERSTGNVSFDSCDASEIYVETSTGDVEGTLLSDKIFMPRTSTGDVEVPETTKGGICKITTSTGDIELKIVGK